MIFSKKVSTYFTYFTFLIYLCLCLLFGKKIIVLHQLRLRHLDFCLDSFQCTFSIPTSNRTTFCVAFP